ncbi:MAG: SpoIIE family protein phosphatase [Acidobacteriota bacterium]
MRRLALVLLLAWTASPAVAQVIDLDEARLPVTALTGPWHFQTGDDPAWAAAEFDDAAWPVIPAEKGWSEQGYKDYAGFAWYRVRVIPSAKAGELALLVPYISNSYEVYVNGRSIGRVGGMPPHGKVLLAGFRLFGIPAGAMTPGKPNAIAIRVWHWPRMDLEYGAGMQAPPLMGDPQLLGMFQTLATHERWWSLSDSQLAFICNFLTAMAGLALFAMRRREREYLWFGAAQLLWAVHGATYLNVIFHPVSYRATEIVIVCTMAMAQLLNLEFFIALMRLRRRYLYWTAATPLFASLLSLVPLEAGLMSNGSFALIHTITQLIYGLCVPPLLYHGARAGNIEARLLLYPFTLSFGCNVVGGLISLPVMAAQPWVQTFTRHFYAVVTWPFAISAMNLAGILAMFSVVVVLVLRFVRSREDEERLASELAAARAVQHVLIPDEIPSVPGYQVECVYRPAGEVGGDFFQILPMDGGALVAIGDVSGKGMPAAMTVSLLVGTLRAMAQSTTRPAELLSSLNRLLMGRTSGGFATCLVLHVSRNGAVSAANAGHIAPYLDGKEMALENGLPLGLDGNAQYAECSLQLDRAEELTLITDGVVEARNCRGELFGFERAAGLAARSAEDIASAAQAFGQTDDITVLRLRRETEGDEGKKVAEAARWSPAPA